MVASAKYSGLGKAARNQRKDVPARYPGRFRWKNSATFLKPHRCA